MTTIVASVKEGLMAADTNMQLDSLNLRCHKLFRIGKKLVGGAGNNDCILKFIKWLEECEKKPGTLPPKLTTEFEGLVLDDCGLSYYDFQFNKTIVEEDVMAIGSGSKYAIGALDFGATVEDAIAVSCRRDSLTREPIEVMYLDDKKQPKKVKDSI